MLGMTQLVIISQIDLLVANLNPIRPHLISFYWNNYYIFEPVVAFFGAQNYQNQKDDTKTPGFHHFLVTSQAQDRSHHIF